MRLLVILSLVSVSIGCTSVPSHRIDGSAESQYRYHGLGGMAQHVTDENNRSDKEARDKCENSKISLVKAKIDKNEKLIEEFSDDVKSYCD